MARKIDPCHLDAGAAEDITQYVNSETIPNWDSVLDAVKNNRAFVFDHPEQRIHFRETYSGIVEACYDDIDAWEREHGTPESNPHGAKLVAGN